MHIAPGLVDPAKMVLAYGAATTAALYTARVAWNELKTTRLTALAARAAIATGAVLSFFQLLPHPPVGVSEVHLILGSTLFLTLGAAPAADYGLVTHAVAADALDTGIERLGQSILAKTPVAVEMGKRAFYRQVDLGLGAAYELATDTMACNLMTEDAAEGIDAFIDKREPVWKGC